MCKLKSAIERREGIQTPILPEDAVSQTKNEASATKVSPAWSYGDRDLSLGRKRCRDKGILKTKRKKIKNSLKDAEATLCFMLVI